MSMGAEESVNKIKEAIYLYNNCLLDSSQIASSLNSLDNTYCCVPTVNDLPAASCNEGRFIYVEDIKSFRYSDGFFWTKDACTVLGDVNTNAGLWSWGRNCGGSLGSGSSSDRCSPGTVYGNNSDWCDISGTAAIKTDGTIWTWGSNTSGRLGDGTTISRCSPGTIWGGGTTWCKISAGSNNILALKTDGTLWTWGSGTLGTIGDGTAVDKCSPVTVAGGGNTWCDISGGNLSSAAIKTDGTLWTWGTNGFGRLGDGTTLGRSSPGTVAGGGTTWCKISMAKAGSSAGAIKCDGTLWTWGYNTAGGLGDGTTINKSSPGTVWGSYTTWSNLSAAGNNQAAAIKCDGTLWTWGSNSQGSLGNGNITQRCSPGTVWGNYATWCQVTVTEFSAMSAIKSDGTLWTWGSSNCGQLGNGSSLTSRCSPGTIIGISGNTWCKVSFSDTAFFAIRTRGF